MKPLFVAIGFLTAVPLPASLRGAPSDLSRSMIAFPVVGLGLGMLIASLDRLLVQVMPTSVVSVLLVLALLGLTGALHLDGLADTADGFLSARPPERILEIMKDPRVGTMGVAAVCGVLMLKAALFGAIPPSIRFATLVLVPTFGRSAMVWVMQMLPYVREQGTGLGFNRRPAWLPLLASILVPAAAGFLLIGRQGVLVWLAALAATGCLALWFRRKIGGWTGDTVGATSELVELIPALLVVALAGWRAA